MAPLSKRVQACEVCRTEVHLQVVIAPKGLPDWVNVTWPDTAWLGWRWEPGRTELTLLAVCSPACLLRWFELEGDSADELVPPCSMPVRN
jgi:hypothetical protein